jgi:hypothetical protein
MLRLLTSEADIVLMHAASAAMELAMRVPLK